MIYGTVLYYTTLVGEGSARDKALFADRADVLTEHAVHCCQPRRWGFVTLRGSLDVSWRSFGDFQMQLSSGPAWTQQLRAAVSGRHALTRWPLQDF